MKLYTVTWGEHILLISAKSVRGANKIAIEEIEMSDGMSDSDKKSFTDCADTIELNVQLAKEQCVGVVDHLSSFISGSCN